MTESWPNLFLVGAQKSGTTSLYEYLKMHPQIFMSPLKEPHFFSQDRVNVDRDFMVTQECDYLRLFEGGETFQYIGEASQSYLWHSEVPHRIKDKSPDAKIIIILRDPVERAFSHYLMDFLDGIPQRPFIDFLVNEKVAKEKVYGTGHLYIDLGRYYEQVNRYFQIFGRDQVRVLLFEDLVRDPTNLLNEIAGFLNIDKEPMSTIPTPDTAFNDYKAPQNNLIQYIMRFRELRIWWRKIIPVGIRYNFRVNFLAKKSPKPFLDPKARQFLVSIYEPEIAELEILLNRELPELRKSWR